MPSGKPKVFISYSGTSDEYQASVVTLAERLVRDGVDVVIDVWDLRPGQDKYAFMEQCVSDESIDRVLILCDAQYARRADTRSGGVGNETEVITPSVYGLSGQTRCVPVVMERDADGKACLPTYLRSRMYVDLSGPGFERGYAELLALIRGESRWSRPDPASPDCLGGVDWTDAGEERESAAIARINARLREQRRGHPSFALMDVPDEGLLPRAKATAKAAPIPNGARLASVDGSESVPLSEVFRDSWRAEEKNHLLMTGRGGIGKTVSLLTFATEEGFLPRNVPAVYIPLYDLAQYHNKKRDCIDEYLRNTFPEDERAAIDGLSHQPWDGGPSLILLLDGHNEVPAGARSHVDMGIRKWAERGGTQVVTTSRIPSLTGIADTRRVELRGLGRDEAKAYLSECGVNLPEDGSNLWQVLETPLMLRLYADVEAFRDAMDVPYVRLEEPDNAGHLVWNYLQRELWRVIEWNRGGYPKAEYAAALLLTLPYVCWRMEASHEFRADADKLEGYAQEACGHWLARERPRGFVATERRLRSRLGHIDVDELVVAQLAILSDETGLLSWNSGGYSLLHQSLRDGLAAIHLKSAMEAPYCELPDEFKQSISEYVKGFLVGLSDQERLFELWESNRNELPTKTIPTNNLLRLMHARFGGDLSALDWSGMDLRVTNLFPFRQGGRLSLSSNKNRFKGTAIDASLFRPVGHSDTVTSLCFSPDGTLLASASTDKSVQIWDSSSGLPTCRSLQDIGARHICFSPSGELLAAARDDGAISILHVSTGRLTDSPTRCIGARHVCFSPDGELLAAACDDGAIRLLCTEDSGFSIIATCEGIGAMNICFSADGKSLTGACGDGRVCFLSQIGEGGWRSVKSSGVDKWRAQLAFYTRDGYIASILSAGDPPFNPNDDIVCENTWLGFFDAESLELQGEPLSLEACYDYDTVCCFCSENSLVALCSEGQGHLKTRLFDVANGQSTVIGNWFNTSCMSLSPDGSLLARGTIDGSIDVYDIRDTVAERLRSNVSRKGPNLGYTKMSGEGKLIAVVDSPSVNRRACHLISVREGALVCGPLCGLAENGDAVSVAPDGSMIAIIAGDGSVHVSDLSNGMVATITLDPNESNANRTLFAPDGSVLIVFYDDGMVRFWNPADGSESFARLEGCRDHRYLSRFSPDGSVFAAVLDNGAISLTDIRLASRHEAGFEMAASAMGFSPDGSLLACGYEEETLVLWETASLRGLTPGDDACMAGFLQGPQVPQRHAVLGGHDFAAKFLSGRRCSSGKIESVCFAQDGSVIACGSDLGHVYICDFDHDAPVRTAVVRGAVHSLRFSPDKTTLAVEYSNETEWGNYPAICLVEAGDGARIGDAIPVPYSDGLACAHFAPDGSIFTVIGPEGTLHCWSRDTGWEAFPIITGADRTLFHASSSEDGSALALVSMDGGTVWLIDRARFSKGADEHSSHVRKIELLSDVDIFGVDLSLAAIESEHDLEVLRQNGAIVPRGPVDYA